MTNALEILVVILLTIVIVGVYKIVQIKKEIKLLVEIRNTFYLVGDKINKVTSKEEVYQLMLDSAVKLIPTANRGSILIKGEDNKFSFKSIIGYPDKLKEVSLNREDVFLYRINNFEGTAIINNPAAFDKKYLAEKSWNNLLKLDVLDIMCSISSPIYLDNRLIGVINVDSDKVNVKFTKNDIDLMNHIKNELQLILKNFYAQEKLRYKANYDDLTGIYNRRHFKEVFFNYLNNDARNKSCLSLIDLDGFKKINDTYGHNTGDDALKFFANTLKEIMSDQDNYARMYGDEFVVLFVNETIEGADKRFKLLREQFNKRLINNISLKFSYGLCEINKDMNISMDEALAIADDKMYLDKRNRKKRS